MNIAPHAVAAVNTNNWFYNGFIAPYTKANIFTKVCGGICGGIAVASITALVVIIFSNSEDAYNFNSKILGGIMGGVAVSIYLVAAANIIPGLAEVMAVASVIFLLKQIVHGGPF